MTDGYDTPYHEFEEPEIVIGADGRNRVVIEGVRLQIDGGRFPVERAAGERNPPVAGADV